VKKVPVPTLSHSCQSSLATAVLLAMFAVITMTCSLLSPNAFAQSESASVSGRVTDQDNLLMPDVDVEIKNSDTGFSYTTKTNGDGIYSFPILPPGNYLINVHKLQFRSVSVTGIVLHVQDSVSRNFVLQVGSADVSITVTADSLNVNTTNGSVSTVIDRNFVQSLPLNGRSFNTLLQLTPGVVIAPVSSSGLDPGQFSIAGQRTDTNNFTVDGVSANFGIGSSLTIGGSGTGTAQAFSALGGTSSLVSVDALQEFRIETSSFAPEFGRSPGGQVILTTRSGTNDLHGGAFDYFRNTVMDANDWFANQRGLPRAAEHHNDFGGYLGGPIWKERTFFFASYEGARLGLPETHVVQVPSTYARMQASEALAPFLDAYPQPNGQPISPTAYIAPFTGNFSNSATLDAGSIRVDHTFDNRFSIFGRYNYAPSAVTNLAATLPSNPETMTTNTQTLTLGVNMVLGARVSNALRGNYSTQNSGSAYAQNGFGGATPVEPDLFLGGLPASGSLSEFVTFDTFTGYLLGTDASNRTKQWNFVDDLSWSIGSHQFKFGGDYRAISLDKRPFQNELLFSANSVQDFLSTGQASLQIGVAERAQLLTQALSLYGQDTWKATPRLTLTYGLRWELSPAPSARGTTAFAAWTNVDNPAELALSPPGTPVWSTTYTNFAPRLGIAYSLTDKADFVVRAGGGVFYDLGVGQAAQLATNFPNFTFGNLSTAPLPLTDATPYIPILSRQPPFPDGVEGFSPDLKLPRSYQWNVAIEKSFRGSQLISATYLGQTGRDLIRQQAFYLPNSNFAGDFLLWQNDARSNYNAIQLQYRKSLSSRVQAVANYTWSHSLDNASNDSVVGLSNAVISGASDYASSDFDVRQSFSGAITYAIPGASADFKPLSVLTEDWSIDAMMVVRTGFPFNGVILFATPDLGGFATSRPDKVPGQPVYISNPTAGGGKSLNPLAFSVPSTPRQGTEGRNDIPGFGLTQLDLSVGRKFAFSERFILQFRGDAFNGFNHPNFTNPPAYVELGPAYLESGSMLNQGLGGLSPVFQEGGPRSLQLSLKLTF